MAEDTRPPRNAFLKEATVKIPTFTIDQIERLWLVFEKAIVYRCLVNGEWMVRFTMEDARALKPLKIEVKKAKDVIRFPVFLKAKLQWK